MTKNRNPSLARDIQRAMAIVPPKGKRNRTGKLMRNIDFLAALRERDLTFAQIRVALKEIRGIEATEAGIQRALAREQKSSSQPKPKAKGARHAAAH